LNWKSLGTFYAGGGGGSSRHAYDESDVARGGAGGSGGGADGAFLNDGTSNDGTVRSYGTGTTSGSSAPFPYGTANTGGGGGGSVSFGWGGNVPAGYKVSAGGSGIVIIRYQSDSQIGSGGTVTSAGGYIYHTFTSSGTYTA